MRVGQHVVRRCAVLLRELCVVFVVKMLAPLHAAGCGQLGVGGQFDTVVGGDGVQQFFNGFHGKAPFRLTF
ncbi:MAG: hypothetical protein COW07_04250 [Hydrogenophilales bacterium CG12_big_fil_rev_8_21_14_0_65_61_21]|nr:MAG: hypothetical protein COW07_04250 [Hydrogenophilales bacterium CG12_big_fil_rev_8_21_14_0_65_61_21]